MTDFGLHRSLFMFLLHDKRIGQTRFVFFVKMNLSLKTLITKYHMKIK